MILSTKLVAVLNKELPVGVALNALGHMAIGFSAGIDINELRLNDYQDQEGNIYPNISQMPFIILRAKSNEIRKTVKAAKELDLVHSVFLNTMTGGTYIEQLENTSKTSEEQLIYYGCILLGPIEEISNLTKRFSLWKD